MKRRLHLVVSRHYESEEDDDENRKNNDSDSDSNVENNNSDNDDGRLKHVPKQVILVDRRKYSSNNNNNIAAGSLPGSTPAARRQYGDNVNDNGNDQELEYQTHDFVSDKLLLGSEFFRENMYPERRIPRFSPSDLKLGQKLGGGEFGKVYSIESLNQKQQNSDNIPGAVVMDGGDDVEGDGDGADFGLRNNNRRTTQLKTNGSFLAEEEDPQSSVVMLSLPRTKHQSRLPLSHSSSEDRCHGSIDHRRIGYSVDATTDDDSSTSVGSNPSSSFAAPFARSQASLRRCGYYGYYYSVDDISDLDNDGEEDIEREHQVDEKRRRMIRSCHRQGEPKYAIKIVRRDLTGWKRYMATIDMACELKFLAALSHPNIIHVRGLLGNIGQPESFGIILDRLSCDLTDKIDEWKRRVPSSIHIIGNHMRQHSFKSNEERHRHKQPGALLGRLMHGRSRSVSPSVFFGSSNSYTARHFHWEKLLTERIMACYDVARAMRYLHQRSILFRDLKPSNVGVTLQGVYVLFDMGLTVELRRSDLVEPPDGYAITGLTGSRMFMAPENALCKPYGFASDSYSFAMLMWEVISMELAFENWKLDKHWQRVILGGERPRSLSHILTPTLNKMMQDAWHEDPSFRPTFGSICEIMKSEIVQRAACDELGIVVDDRTEHLRKSSSESFTDHSEPRKKETKERFMEHNEVQKSQKDSGVPIHKSQALAA